MDRAYNGLQHEQWSQSLWKMKLCYPQTSVVDISIVLITFDVDNFDSNN